MIIEVNEREGINDLQTLYELTTQLQIYRIHLAVNLFAHAHVRKYLWPLSLRSSSTKHW
jgi:hypothetical protein